MKRISSYFFAFITALSLLLMVNQNLSAATSTDSFATRPDVQKFIQMMVKDYGFKQTELTTLFNSVKQQPVIVKGMSKTKEHLPWYQYRSIFITQQRIDEGVAFWKKHQKTLDFVYKKDGVDPSVIIAIIGVETYYGKNQGSYRVIDSLSTLAFNYPDRAKFFQHELKEFLLLTRENHINPTTIRGSYAGAMGQPQFMPSSYRMYAIDFAKSGQRDLFNNPDDVIASVSNYLKHHGWQTGQPGALLSQVSGNRYQLLPKQTLKPTLTLAEFAKYGIKPDTAYSPNEKATFMALEMADAKHQYWLGLNNFYVITRYNPRINYAMAVYQLSQEINKQKNRGG